MLPLSLWGAESLLDSPARSSALLEQFRSPQSTAGLHGLAVRWGLTPRGDDPCWHQFGAGLACRGGLSGMGQAVSPRKVCGKHRALVVGISQPCPLSATMEQAALLNRDCSLSFHLGRHSLEPQVFAQAVAEAQLAFDMGAELGYRMHLLDIGGGFPGTEDTRAQFEEVCGSQCWLWVGRKWDCSLPCTEQHDCAHSGYIFPSRLLL